MTEKSMLEKLARAAFPQPWDASDPCYPLMEPSRRPTINRVRAVLLALREADGATLKAIRMGPRGRNPSLGDQNLAELGWLRGIDHILNEGAA